jgi:hypothetical protein
MSFLQIPRANSLMMRSYVVFALVVSQVLLPWMPPDIVHILCNFITDPKVTHLHQMQSLLFYGIICDANSSGVIAMDLCFGLGMAQFFKGHPKIMPSLQFRKRAPSLALVAEATPKQRMVHKVKNAPFSLIGLLSFSDQPMKKCPHALLHAFVSGKYDVSEC